MQEETTRHALYIKELRELQLKYNDLNNCCYKIIIDNALKFPENMTRDDVSLFENWVLYDLHSFLRQSVNNNT